MVRSLSNVTRVSMRKTCETIVRARLSRDLSHCLPMKRMSAPFQMMMDLPMVMVKETVASRAEPRDVAGEPERVFSLHRTCVLPLRATA